MNLKTLNKISFLQTYIRKNFGRWARKHQQNIIGVRVDKKYSGGKKKPYYCIVFHVAKKFNIALLSGQQRIPLFFDVKFPNGVIQRIPTDVHETGRFSFQSGILDLVKDITAGKEGTIGVFVKKGQQAFAVTNYHVAAGALMKQGVFFFDSSSAVTPDTLFIDDASVPLDTGILSAELDVAFVNAGSVDEVSNNLPGNFAVGDFESGPIDATWNGKSVFIFSQTNRAGKTVQILNNSATFDPQVPQVGQIGDTIALQKCTNDGDSGSIVVSNDLKVLGIVTGADDSFTYVIPFHKIFKFNKLPIL